MMPELVSFFPGDSPRFSNETSGVLVFSFADGNVQQHQVVPDEIRLKVIFAFYHGNFRHREAEISVL